MGLVMPPGFHSSARWLDLCCEMMQRLIVGDCTSAGHRAIGWRKKSVDDFGYYFWGVFIKIECIQLFFDVSMVIV